MAEVTDGLRVVQASEILEKIQKGEPVEYNSVTIDGDLDLSKLDMPIQYIERTKAQRKLGLPEVTKSLASSIMITNSEVRGKLSFNDMTFLRPVVFEKSEFKADVNFTNAILNSDTYFNNATFMQGADFRQAMFGADSKFINAKFHWRSDFSNTTFIGSADFREATFSMGTDFTNAIFHYRTNFDEAKFSKSADFRAVMFSDVIYFDHAKFIGLAIFYRTNFSNNAYFNNTLFQNGCDFSNAQFKGESFFWNTQVDRELSFLYAKFETPKSQEQLSRIGRNFSEKNGDKAESDYYYYYQEMDAMRKQKPWYIRYPELILIQLVTGYGVYPFRLYFWWFLFVSFFAFVYWNGKGVIGATEPVDYIWFSITTAITPGFAGYNPDGIYKIVAGFEAIIGSMLWAVFLATFANKYFRRG